MFYRGFAGNFTIIHKLLEDNITFVSESIPYDRFNLLQLAVQFNGFELVKYILTDHKINTTTRQAKSVDPRIIVTDQEDDETLTLRLAVNNNNPEIF